MRNQQILKHALRLSVYTNVVVSIYDLVAWVIALFKPTCGQALEGNDQITRVPITTVIPYSADRPPLDRTVSCLNIML